MELAIADSRHSWRIDTTEISTKRLKVTTSSGAIVAVVRVVVVVARVSIAIVRVSIAVVRVRIAVVARVVACVVVRTVVASVSIACTRSTYGAALVVDRLDSGEVRGLAKDCVESVSLGTGLRFSGCSGCRSTSARVTGSLVGTAGVDELIADGLGDDIDVLR